jgi:hypothetical protein
MMSSGANAAPGLEMHDGGLNLAEATADSDYRATSAVLNALTLNTKALAKGREKKKLSQQHQVRQLRQAQGPIRPLWIQYTPRDNH